MLHLPRVMLAAPKSGSGKTMITCGLLSALLARGLNPSSFKCGPDYIDPMFHTRVIGTPSRNLDPFFTDAPTTRMLFARAAKDAGISVLEGVMGIYDGLGVSSHAASSYDLASVTETPVVLIVDARGMSLSVIPMIQGFLDYPQKAGFGPNLIQGVILNRVTASTFQLMKEEIEKETGIIVYGYVPDLSDAAVGSRHLGLVTPDEIADMKERLVRVGAELEKSLDIDGIISLADKAPDYEDKEKEIPASVRALVEDSPAPVRIAVAMDEAFCFYYQDNLDLLKMLGAELVPFSPLRDQALPENIGGMILGGGYPELYAKNLSENTAMLKAVRKAVFEGIPFLAECGGFMYLHQKMEDLGGYQWPVCGCIPADSYHTKGLRRFGYISLGMKETGFEEAKTACGFLLPKETIRAHEFHYFDSTDPGSAYTAKKPLRQRTWDCMHVTDHSAAGFPHLYYWSNPSFAARFLACAREYGDQKAGVNEQ